MRYSKALFRIIPNAHDGLIGWKLTDNYFGSKEEADELRKSACLKEGFSMEIRWPVSESRKGVNYLREDDD